MENDGLDVERVVNAAKARVQQELNPSFRFDVNAIEGGWDWIAPNGGS